MIVHPGILARSLRSPANCTSWRSEGSVAVRCLLLKVEIPFDCPATQDVYGGAWTAQRDPVVMLVSEEVVDDHAILPEYTVPES